MNRLRNAHVLGNYLPQIVIFFLLTACSDTAPRGWDYDLVSAPLGRVEIRAQTLLAAWTEISEKGWGRTVLYLDEGLEQEIDFTFTSDTANARELLNALMNVFSDYTWTPDEKTGVIWIHPSSLKYSEILTRKVRVAANQLSIPMYSGVVEALWNHPELKIFPAARPGLGGGFLNTVDYLVNFEAGEYTVRDLFNVGCISNPTKSFLIYKHGLEFWVTPMNMYYEFRGPIQPGADLLWDKTYGSYESETDEDIQKRLAGYLADPDPEKRKIARGVAEARIHETHFGDWLKNTESPEQATWLALAQTDIRVRFFGIILTQASDVLKTQASEEFLLHGDAVMATYIALELYRLTDDEHPLEVLAGREFTHSEIRDLEKELDSIVAIFRRSPNLASLARDRDEKLSSLSFLELHRFSSEDNLLEFELR